MQLALPTNLRRLFIKGRYACVVNKQTLPGDVGMTVTELATYAEIHAAEL
jgi:hypothetical protein